MWEVGDFEGKAVVFMMFIYEMRLLIKLAQTRVYIPRIKVKEKEKEKDGRWKAKEKCE